MFVKVLRSPTTDTCHNTRLEHGGSVKTVSPMSDFHRIWKTEASVTSWALLLRLWKVSLILDLAPLAIKPTWAAKSSDNLGKTSYFLTNTFFLWIYTPHLILQMCLNKHSDCLKYSLAQFSTVECSEKPQKEDTGKHPDFFSVTGFMAFACVNVLTINISILAVVDSPCESSCSPSIKTSSIFLPTCSWSGSPADPLWGPSASTQNFKHKQWKTDWLFIPWESGDTKTMCSAED